MDNAKILIVEDEFLNAYGLKVELEKCGHMVVGIAPTGEKACKLARDENPDMILMDIILDGEMDGIDAASIILSECKTHLIFLTANSDMIKDDRVNGLHPSAVFIKPLFEKDLMNEISRLSKKN